MGSCDDSSKKSDAPKPSSAKPSSGKPGTASTDTRPPPLAQPVDFWQEGKIARQIDAATASEDGFLLLDVGDTWVPYIFTERDVETEESKPNAYRDTYLKLARGVFPRNHHGERARDDKYLELYGIPPTLSLIRKRMRHVAQLECAQTQDLTPFEDFKKIVVYRGNERARFLAEHVPFLQRQLAGARKRLNIDETMALPMDQLKPREQRYMREYRKLWPRYAVTVAAQERLRCEGYLKGKGRIVKGGMDWGTHEALAEFERRHRVYAWGALGGPTLRKLRKPAMELEREALIRVLTERAMHAAGVIEDGSTSKTRRGKPRTYQGADGKRHRIRNLEGELRHRIVKAFGLNSPEAALAWLETLGDLSAEKKTYFTAITAPRLPEYYTADMDLSITIDRGDVWYEFPFDNMGNRVEQKVKYRPHLTVYTFYRKQRIPLATFGTTIGGWRSEKVDEAVMWKYKESPVGTRVWHQIVASPVWLPPESTPHRALLTRDQRRRARRKYRVNYHETGPSYASAYGLVAAYHIKFWRNAQGEIQLGGDEGIRTHGSVDYMSIMRRNSHGCHRLHNHIAVRLMSFVLAHRPHVRVGQQRHAFERILVHEEEEYLMEIKHGGYVFDLERPVFVEVLPGRVLGQVKEPIDHAVPQYDEEAGAYWQPDGGAVRVDSFGRIVEIDPDTALESEEEGLPSKEERQALPVLPF